MGRGAQEFLWGQSALSALGRNWGHFHQTLLSLSFALNSVTGEPFLLMGKLRLEDGRVDASGPCKVSTLPVLTRVGNLSMRLGFQILIKSFSLIFYYILFILCVRGRKLGSLQVTGQHVSLACRSGTQRSSDTQVPACILQESPSLAASHIPSEPLTSKVSRFVSSSTL